MDNFSLKNRARPEPRIATFGFLNTQPRYLPWNTGDSWRNILSRARVNQWSLRCVLSVLGASGIATSSFEKFLGFGVRPRKTLKFFAFLLGCVNLGNLKIIQSSQVFDKALAFHQYNTKCPRGYSTGRGFYPDISLFSYQKSPLVCDGFCLICSTVLKLVGHCLVLHNVLLET